MKNILVTGSKGQLGSEIAHLARDYTAYTFYLTDKKELDICNTQAVEAYVRSRDIGIIINCAAYTAVDNAESASELADKLNHIAVRGLAKIAKDQGIKLIHLSTDYVFDGKGYQPYPTDYPTAPVNTYGKTKQQGEAALKTIDPENSLIIRTSWVYSSFGNNFVKTILRLGEEKDQLHVICDQVGVPTYARDLARFILNHTLQTTNTTVATYHYTNEGVCSWYDFAKEILELGKISCKLSPVPTSAYPTAAIRPFYSLMDKTSLKQDFNVEIPYWKESLAQCIRQLTGATQPQRML